MVKNLRFCLFPAFIYLLLLSAGCSDKPVDNISLQVMDSLRVEELVKTTKSWNGTRLPEYPEGQPEITILQISIPAGTRLETHSHPVINAGVLTKGELTVYTKNDEVLKLKAGDPIVEVVNTLHYGINEGNETAEIIVFYSGIEDMPITVIHPDK